MSPPINHTGKTFGRLTTIERISAPRKKTVYKCVCSCGASVVVKSNSLVTGHTKSCGCLGREVKANMQHGMTGTPEYEAFKHMWCRTTNPRNKDFENYKWRRPPEAWRDFSVFLAEVGMRPSARHSLDRIENTKGYGPGNVRWATAEEQANNSGKNVKLSLNGETLNVSQWARKLSVNVDALYGRLRRGWSTERVLATKRLEIEA